MHSALIGGQEQADLLTTALEMGLADGRYVFVPYDTLLYSLPYQNNSFSVFDNDSKLREAYDAVLTITLESGERTFYDAFREAKESGEIIRDLEATQVNILSLGLFWDLSIGNMNNSYRKYRESQSSLHTFILRKIQRNLNVVCFHLERSLFPDVWQYNSLDSTIGPWWEFKRKGLCLRLSDLLCTSCNGLEAVTLKEDEVHGVCRESK